MKKLIIITLCMLCLLSCEQKRPAMVELPVFEVSNTTMLEIDKIEMSETVTILYFTAYMRSGGWIAIDPKTYLRASGGDEQLKVSESDGITIGEQTTISESGTLSFKLFFPPLKPEITKIDFIEDIPENGWKILGISLLPKTKIAIDPIPADAFLTKSEALPAATFSTKPAKVSGKLLGYSEDLGIKKITAYSTNIITGENIEVEFPVSADGSFSGEITPGIGGFVTTSEGSMFLVPGKESSLIVDLKKRSRFQSRNRPDKQSGDSLSTYLSGSYFTISEQNEINRLASTVFNNQQLMQEVVYMKPEEYKKHLLGLMNKRLDEIKQESYRPNMLTMIENNIKLRVCLLLFQYESFMKSAYISVNNIKRENMDTVSYTAIKPEVTYYTFLKELLNDNMSYLQMYNVVITFISRFDYFTMQGGSAQPVKQRFAYFKEKATPIIGTDNKLLFDVIQAQYYAMQLGDMRLFSDAEKQELKNVFSSNPAYAETLIDKNDKIVELLASNKDNKDCVMHEPPNVPQEKMFDVILAKYKGKVVLVDFWATWCGPCIAAMKTIKPVKDEMKDKDVVFLYLTGETSPLGTWIQTYPTITGEHFRVSDAQWRYWCTTFEIPGIPCYMIYDRKGNRISKYIGFPGVSAVKEDIEKGL